MQVANIVNHSTATALEVAWDWYKTGIGVIPNVPLTHPTPSLQSSKGTVHTNMAPIGKLYSHPQAAQTIAVGRHYAVTL